MAQFVSVKFNPWDRRTYCYRIDDPDLDLAAGDRVEVPAKNGLTEAIVESLLDAPPPDCPPDKIRAVARRLPMQPLDVR